MSGNKQSENNELKKRFDSFYRSARYQSKPYRLLGRAQIANKHVSILVAYPTLENEGEKASFAETLVNQIREYGLDPVESLHQKAGLRIQARLLLSVPSAENKETTS